MKIVAVNCNSLNLTSNSDLFDMKIHALSSINSDVIFLSDIRMGEIANQKATHKITTAFLKTNLKFFDFYFNSSVNKRGVAMLVKKTLQLVPVNEFKDLDENILLMRFSINCGEFVLGSIYGPNTTNRTFYSNISRYLENNTNCPVIVGGDWNATWDNSPPENNLDIANMVRPPNPANGGLLRELAQKFNMADPFRTLFPDKIAFSYNPFGVMRKNRSHIDFFLPSTGIIDKISDTGIFTAQLSNMFDHKPVYLNIGARVNKSQVNSKNKKLTNWFLDEKIIEMSVALSALQILSHSINAAIHPDSVTQIRNSINFLTNKLLESLALLEKIARNCGGDNKTDEMLLGALYAEFYANSDLLPSFDNLFMLNSMYSKKEVFISLTDRIAEKVSALQIKFKKFSNISKKTIEKTIAELSGDFYANEQQICELESKVRAINDFKIHHLMQEKNFFENLNFEKPSKGFLGIAKAVSKTEDISVIRDANGEVFENNTARNEYITNFYSTLYRKDEGISGSIEEFLGEDICQHKLVQDSKLTGAERESLEADLTLEELEKALGESNMRSAPGIDGFSNKFIKKI